MKETSQSPPPNYSFMKKKLGIGYLMMRPFFLHS